MCGWKVSLCWDTNFLMITLHTCSPSLSQQYFYLHPHISLKQLRKNMFALVIQPWSTHNSFLLHSQDSFLGCSSACLPAILPPCHTCPHFIPPRDFIASVVAVKILLKLDKFLICTFHKSVLYSLFCSLCVCWTALMLPRNKLDDRCWLCVLDKLGTRLSASFCFCKVSYYEL